MWARTYIYHLLPSNPPLSKPLPFHFGPGSRKPADSGPATPKSGEYLPSDPEPEKTAEEKKKEREEQIGLCLQLPWLYLSLLSLIGIRQQDDESICSSTEHVLVVCLVLFANKIPVICGAVLIEKTMILWLNVSLYI